MRGNGCAGYADEIERIVMRMYRLRHSSNQARPKARRVTPELSRALAFTEMLNPDLSHREIGAMFGVDGGRVSEAVQAYRERRRQRWMAA